MPEAGLQPY